MKNFTITAADIHQYVRNNGDLFLLEYEADYFETFISQKTIHDIVHPPRAFQIMSYKLSPEDHKLAEEMRKKEALALPQKTVNEQAAKGYDLKYFTKEQIKAIPQDTIIQRADKGQDLSGLSEAQIKAVPKEIILHYVTNGGNQGCLTEDQLNAIPQEIKVPTENGLNALILYGAGIITSQDLPLDVFVNNRLRLSLLRTIRNKTEKQFKEVCRKNGFENKDNIPKELKESFDEKIESIHDEITKRKELGLKNLQEPLKNAVHSTMSLGW